MDLIKSLIVTLFSTFLPLLVLFFFVFGKNFLRELKIIQWIESFLNNQKDKNAKVIEKVAIILAILIFISFSFWVISKNGINFEVSGVLFSAGFLLFFIYPLLIYLILLVPGFLLLLLNEFRIIRLKKNKVNNLILNSGAFSVLIILIILIESLNILGSILAAIFIIYFLHFKKNKPKEGGFEYLPKSQRFLLYVIFEDLCDERNYKFKKDELIEFISKRLTNEQILKKNISKIIKNELSELVDKGILTKETILPCWQVSNEIYLYSNYYKCKLKNNVCIPKLYLNKKLENIQKNNKN